MPGSAVSSGAQPGGASTDRRRLEPWRPLDDGHELGRELAERGVSAALPDQAERRGVPERRRPAVAEHHLVTVREGQQRRDAVAYPATRRLTAGRRCDVPSRTTPPAMSEATASGLTLDGPEPNRPSSGCSPGGRRMDGDGGAHDHHARTAGARARCDAIRDVRRRLATTRRRRSPLSTAVRRMSQTVVRADPGRAAR